jgi:hypothetical protein
LTIAQIHPQWLRDRGLRRWHQLVSCMNIQVGDSVNTSYSGAASDFT